VPSVDIAILSPLATPLYVDDRREDGQRSTGGAELQMFQLARALATADLSVAHVVFDSPGLVAEREGVTVAALPPRKSRPVQPRASVQLVALLAQVRPKLVIQRSAGFDTGVAALFAKATGRRFVFSSSSSADFTLDTLRDPKTIAAYRAGLRLADRVVVQTDDQGALAARLRGRNAHVIRSFCEPAADSGSPGAREYFLWIGGVIDYKGPLAYLDLAAKLPDAQFLMVATGRGSRFQGLAQAVSERAAALPNCELLGGRPRAALLELYERAVAVVNTSVVEGFPNTFMEGWARGAPALSLNVDPDGVIARYGLGVIAEGSLDALAAGARALWDRRGVAADEHDRCRAYIERHHAPAVVGAAWAELVRELL
jgi:glycosyltransferase involved in cell wall biosynthesis